MRPSRRQFIQRCATVIGGAATLHAEHGPQVSAAVDGTLVNWAGNYRYSTDRLHPATSVQQVQDYVKNHARFKVLGTRHCFNGIADSTVDLLSLREMNRVVSLDSAGRTVTIQAGMSYGQLCPYLHEQGFALHNLASLPHISVTGACATATHGSGVKNGNLATAVTALEIVTADGEVLNLSREKDGSTFEGSVVNLGAIGVVTKVTLTIQPTFVMRQDVYLDLPMVQVKDHFEEIAAAGYSVSLFTDWQKGRVNEVWVKRRVDKGVTLTADEFYGARRATQNVHPIVELSAENCTEQMGVPGPWYDRLPHFRMGFTPSSGKELQSEYSRPTPECGGGDPRGRAVTGFREPAPDDLGAAHHRGGRTLDEPVLQPAEPRHPLHLEAGLGVRPEGAADDRAGADALRRQTALGQVVHSAIGATAAALREVRRVQAAGRALRSKGEVTQRVPDEALVQLTVS